jgi:hypothetical protein
VWGFLVLTFGLIAGIVMVVKALSHGITLLAVIVAVVLGVPVFMVWLWADRIAN